MGDDIRSRARFGTVASQKMYVNQEPMRHQPNASRTFSRNIKPRSELLPSIIVELLSVLVVNGCCEHDRWYAAPTDEQLEAWRKKRGRGRERGSSATVCCRCVDVEMEHNKVTLEIIE